MNSLSHMKAAALSRGICVVLTEKLFVFFLCGRQLTPALCQSIDLRSLLFQLILRLHGTYSDISLCLINLLPIHLTYDVKPASN